ncbi:hypothetical protein GF324_12070 [bacterium]|nr:hypothetical protein [bacterium]
MLDGPFGLILGFIGLVGMGYGWANHTLDMVGYILFGLLIAVGLWTVYRRVSGKTEENAKPRGPLSSRKRKK